MEKEKIKPLYEEFQGYLSQVPKPELPGTRSYDDSLWNQYNEAVDLLNKISGEDFDRFKIQPRRESGFTACIIIDTYRQKLGGLISHLHGKYFPDELPPFAGMPTTVITQTQQQNQTVQMLFEIRDKIEAKMAGYAEGSKEKKFLQKFKESLTSISTWAQLLTQLFKTGKDYGLDIDSISRIFG